MQHAQGSLLSWLLLLALCSHAAPQVVDLGPLLLAAVNQAGPAGAHVVTLTAPAAFITTPSILIPAGASISITSGPAATQSVAWSLSSTTITLAAGASLTLSNLNITLPAPVPVPNPSAVGDAWADLLKLPGISLNSGSRVYLKSVGVQLDSCLQVQRYQAAVCDAVSRITSGSGSDSTWTMPGVLPGSLHFPASSSQLTASAGWTMSGVHVTCASNSNQTAVPTTPCTVQAVSSAAQMRTALLSMPAQTAPGGQVVLQLIASISLSETAWPVQGVNLTNPVVLAGLPGQGWNSGSNGTELDLAGLRAFVNLNQDTASIAFTDLSLTNLPIGKDDVFPTSMLVGALWCVNFNRNTANRTMLLLQNSQVVVPQDLFNYLSWWTAAQSSLVPSLRDRAEWLKSNIYYGLSLGVADSHFLLFSRREGLGTLWINSTLTDLPFKAPLVLQKTGIQDLAANDANVPLNKVVGVSSAEELMSALSSSDAIKTYLVLLQGINLNATVVQKAASDLNTSTTNTSSGGIFPLSRAVNLIGRPDTPPVFLDFGAVPSLLDVALAQGSRLTLQRLVLTGLGPAGPTSLPPGSAYTTLAGNLTSFLWPFSFQRKQPQLRLQDVTLLVPKDELNAFQQALGPQARQAGQPAVSPNVLSAIQALWPVANVVSSNDTSLLLSDLAYSGLEGSMVRLTSVVPAWLDSARITPPPSLPLTLPDASSTSSDGGSLNAGTIAGIVAGVAVLGAVSLVGLFMWHKRVQHLKKQVDIERGEKAAALEQVQQLVSARNTPAPSTDTKDPTSIDLFNRDMDVASQANGNNSNSASYPSQHNSSQLNQDTAMFFPTNKTSGGGSQPSGGSSKDAQTGQPGASRQGGGQKQGSSNLSLDSSNRTGHTSDSRSPHNTVARGSHDFGDLVPEQVQPGAVSGLLGPPLVVVVENLPLDVSALHATASGGTPSSSRKSGGSKGSGGAAADVKRMLLNKGLAAGDDDEEPESVLQQIINHRKEMQGIDMQQVEFQQVLGQGSFGVVYKGRWRSLTVAIKTLMFQDAGATKRIRQRAITEAAINTLLSHDNIINTYAYDLRPVAGSGLPDDKHAVHWKLYIIQEFCDGGSLSQAIDKGMFIDPHTKKVNMVHVLQIAEDIAKGMAYIHAANVLHGDLSSGNIMLRFDPRMASCFQAKVGDFGLSRFLEGPEHSHISNARQGTPFYIAPEVLTQGIISKDADVFSFGVLLWEMFCGMPPWRDPALVAMRTSLNPRTYPYHVPMSCPSEYHALIMACLAEQPKARPRFSELQQHISDLLKMLKQAITLRAQRQGLDPGQLNHAPAAPMGYATAQVMMPVQLPVSDPPAAHAVVTSMDAHAAANAGNEAIAAAHASMQAASSHRAAQGVDGGGGDEPATATPPPPPPPPTESII